MNPIYLSLIPALWLAFKLGFEYGKRKTLKNVMEYTDKEVARIRAKRAASLCMQQADIATGTPIAAAVARELGIDLNTLTGKKS